MTNKLSEVDGLEYVIIRGVDIGIHVGYIDRERSDIHKTILKNCRWIRYWDGGNTIHEIAMKGPANPDKCQFTVVAPEIEFRGVCSIIPCTDIAKQRIEDVPIWEFSES